MGYWGDWMVRGGEMHLLDLAWAFVVRPDQRRLVQQASLELLSDGHR